MEPDTDMNKRGSAPVSSVQVGRKESAGLPLQAQHLPVTLQVVHV